MEVSRRRRARLVRKDAAGAHDVSDAGRRPAFNGVPSDPGAAVFAAGCGAVGHRMVAKAVEGLVPVVGARIPEEVLHTPHPFKDPIVPIMSRCACSRPVPPQSGPSPQSAPLRPRRRALSAGGCLVALVLALTPALAGCDDSLAEDTPTTDSASATAAAEEAGEEQDQQQAQDQPESDQIESDQTESDQTQEQSGGGSSGVYYANCKEARAAGAAPLYLGESGYRAELDRDHDGIACEK